MNPHPIHTEPALIAVSLIHPSPLNPRRVAEKERGDLAPSLRVQGQLMALWVRPHPKIAGGYELVDGERRWWGMTEAGIAEARVEVGNFSDEDILRITWTTGTEGKGLTAIEQARWARAAMARPGATLESVGALVGVQGSALRKRMLLLDLPAEIQDAVQAGDLPPMTAFLIAGVPGAAQERFAHEVLHPEDEKGPLSYAAAETLRRASYARTLKAAPFDGEDAGLVPHAGACSECRYRAGNNVEEYGPTKSPNTCMHVECFGKKETAARARAVAKEAGKVALSAEENARVFPEGAVEPSAASGYVAATRPIPADLVKDEVAAQGAPSFSEVSPAARVYVGTDGNGRLVDLVELAQAITAATEPAIFRAVVVARYGLRDNEGGHHRNSADEVVNTPALRDVAPEKAEPTKGSIAGEEKKRAKAEKSAAKSHAKKLRACAEWAGRLHEAMTAPVGRPKGWAYTRASLLWEHLILSVPDEDALLVLRAVSDEEPAKKETGKAALKSWVAGLGGTEELEAVCFLLIIASALRAQGPEAAWVVEWHTHLIAPVEEMRDAGADAAAEGIASEEERAKLTAIARAHAEGMPVREIARSFALPLAEVCGALEVPVPADDAVEALPEGVGEAKADLIVNELHAGKWLHEIAYSQGVPAATVRAVLAARGYDKVETDAESEEQMRSDIEELFTRIGYTKASEWDAVAKMAAKLPWAEVVELDHLQRVYDALSRIALAKAEKARKAASAA